MKVHWNLFFIGLLLAFGCSFLKNTSKSSKTSQSDSAVFRFYSDSSSYEEEVLIWPKGKFSYSPGTGFFGEAEKIQLKEKGRSKNFAAEITRAQSTAEERLLVKAAKFDWMLWGLIAVVSIYLSLKFYKLC